MIQNDSLTFTQRLKACLDTIIDDCQSGFMQGRHISNNIRLILDLIDYKDYITDNSYILFIDIYKAFDTIKHSFLFDVLDFLAFVNTTKEQYKLCIVTAIVQLNFRGEQLIYLTYLMV